MNQTAPIISTTPAIDDVEDGEDVGLKIEIREFAAHECHHGQRIDRVLAGLNSEFSRSYLQQLVMDGAFTLNGVRVAKVSNRIKAGDRCRIELRPTPQSQAFTPERMDINVVFEDEHLVVVNKPAGMVVHPAPGNWSGTLLNGLLAKYPRASDVPRAGIVHRLDKDTSGLMVVAKTRRAMDVLVSMIAARQVSRRYLAIANGPWVGARLRRVDAPIGRDPGNRLRMAVVDLLKNSGKQAQTDISLIKNGEKNCLVLCTLHTGRTHQIRVHLASIGHPLLSDQVYGGRAIDAMPRQALHAFHLSFEHPFTLRQETFRAAPPSDFQHGLAQLGLRYNEAGLS